MYRLAIAAALAACNVPAFEPAPAPGDAEPPADAANPDALDATPLIATPLPIAPPARLVTAMHGSDLRAIAVTEDGKLAVSADVRGSLRLWPSLDGTREPVVVAGTPASQLAVVHTADQVAIAALDRLGVLEVITLTARGEPIARVVPPLVRPIAELHAIDTGFLALRDDGIIVHITGNGAIAGVLRPDPGQHVTTLAVRRGAALAVVDTRAGVRGRWIELAKLRWGKTTPLLDIDGTHVVLSPDHGKIAATARDAHAVCVVDVEDARVLECPLTHNFPDPALAPVGYVDDDSLAIDDGVGHTIEWSSGGYTTRDDHRIGTAVAVVADGMLVGENAGALVLQPPPTSEDSVHFLGYQMGFASRLRPVAGGWLATDTMHVVALDDHVRTRRVYALPDPPDARYGWRDLRFVDDGHVLAAAYTGSTEQLALLDLAHRTATPYAVGGSVVDYDERRGVVAFHSRDGIGFARYDARTGTLGTPALIAAEPGRSQYVQLGEGELAAVASWSYAYRQDTPVTITHVRAIGDDGRLVIGEVRRLTLPKEWWQTNGNITSLLRPVTPPASGVWPSPDGKLVATLHDGRVTLRDDRGHERWTAAAWGARELAWGRAGELVANGQGLARFDVATGMLAGQQCGWVFGLWDKPVGRGEAALCEQSWMDTE